MSIQHHVCVSLSVVLVDADIAQDTKNCIIRFRFRRGHCGCDVILATRTSIELAVSVRLGIGVGGNCVWKMFSNFIYVKYFIRKTFTGRCRRCRRRSTNILSCHCWKVVVSQQQSEHFPEKVFVKDDDNDNVCYAHSLIQLGYDYVCEMMLFFGIGKPYLLCEIRKLYF